MDMSFYVGMLGMKANQQKLDVVSNNLANINTTGFKPKSANFQELVNYNLNGSREEVTNLQAGAGVKNASTKNSISQGALTTTNDTYNFALTKENEYFMLEDPVTGQVTYTRDGNFHAGQDENGEYYLTTASGKFVLDNDGERVPAQVYTNGQELEGIQTDQPGVVSFPHPTRLLNKGDNELEIDENDTENEPVIVENPSMMQGMLESSNTDMAFEMAQLIKAQRGLQYSLKALQTSDELEGTVNQLRG